MVSYDTGQVRTTISEASIPAQEYHVERYLCECLIPRTAPVSPHIILNYLAGKVLELPKAY
jgi:hypothetical protein